MPYLVFIIFNNSSSCLIAQSSKSAENNSAYNPASVSTSSLPSLQVSGRSLRFSLTMFLMSQLHRAIFNRVCSEYFPSYMMVFLPRLGLLKLLILRDSSHCLHRNFHELTSLFFIKLTTCSSVPRKIIFTKQMNYFSLMSVQLQRLSRIPLRNPFIPQSSEPRSMSGTQQVLNKCPFLLLSEFLFLNSFFQKI